MVKQLFHYSIMDAVDVQTPLSLKAFQQNMIDLY